MRVDTLVVAPSAVVFLLLKANAFGIWPSLVPSRLKSCSALYSASGDPDKEECDYIIVGMGIWDSDGPNYTSRSSVLIDLETLGQLKRNLHYIHQLKLSSHPFLPEEKNPKHCIKHKLHITKVMFLCAIVHPRFNPSANSRWDGKLGIWPLGDWELVKCKYKKETERNTGLEE